MTDLARIDHNAVAAFDGATEHMVRLGQWVEAARNAHQLVAPLIDTAFIPDAYKPKFADRDTEEVKSRARGAAIANATAAVLHGLSLGVDPMVALQQIYIIHGRPGLYADFMVALLQSRGHEVWTEDLSDTKAVVCGRRKGSEYVERVVVTMDQARKAGWTSNQAYGKTPQDMLYARAAGRVCKRVAPDVLKGIASVEEIEDTIRAEASVGNGTRTVTPRKRQPVAALSATQTPEEPPLDVEEAAPDTPPEEPTDGEKGITGAQLKMLHALMGKAGYGDRDEGLAYLSQQIGRDVTSSKELTKAEASRVIDGLAMPPEPKFDEALWPETAEVPL